MPFIISFSGLDGSGKTQLIVLMRRFLLRQGIKHLQIHFITDSLENRLATKILGERKISELSEKRNSAVENKKMGLAVFYLRLFFLLVYAFMLKIKLFRLKKICSVVIFDRYIYDRLIQVAYLRGKKDLSWTKRIVKMFPRPNLPIFLHVNPEESLKRKKELALEGQNINYLQEKYFLFDQGKDLWGLVAVDNSILSVSEAKRKIIAIFKKKYLRFKKNKRK